MPQLLLLLHANKLVEKPSFTTNLIYLPRTCFTQTQECHNNIRSEIFCLNNVRLIISLT